MRHPNASGLFCTDDVNVGAVRHIKIVQYGNLGEGNWSKFNPEAKRHNAFEDWNLDGWIRRSHDNPITLRWGG